MGTSELCVYSCKPQSTWGVITDPRYPKDPQELPRKQKREPKMCNPQQQNPPQNAAWQGVYPDLSALNQLFSTQQALQRMQDSPLRGLTSWLLLACSPSQEARLRSNSNKPDLSRNNLLPHQHLRLRDTGSHLCRSKLCCLASTSTPSISRSIPTTSRSLLRLLLRCSPHLPTPPDDHQPPAPLLLGRHQGLRHLLLHHRLPLLPLQPPRLPHLVHPLRGARHLSPPHALAPVLAGHLLYSAISFLHPVCALFLLLPCLHKLHVRGQPLGDPVSWGVRFTGSNAAWNQHMNHNHYQY